MRVPTEQEMKRIDDNFVMLDLAYRSLRDFTALQRAAFASGNLHSQRICDTHIQLLGASASQSWGNIQQILMEVYREQQQEQQPVTEVLQ